MTAAKLDQITITAIGDGNVGKTYMLMRFVDNKIPNDYIPTVFENYYGKIHVDGDDHKIHLWDTAGQEDYDRLRALSYPSVKKSYFAIGADCWFIILNHSHRFGANKATTDCFLVCFALNSTSSYLNIQDKWIPEIKHHKKSAPIILVGTKSDLKNDPSEETLSTADCLKLKEQIRSYKYVECSAFTNEGIQSVFSEAVRAVIYKVDRKKSIFKKCDIL